jgi:uncharacterized membrane protein YGL010W
MREHLLDWQWSDYSAKHRNRTNLLLHIFVVPLFDAAMFILVFALISWLFVLAGLALACMLFSMILQGRGHKFEKESPAPFAGALDFPTRFLAEQWITFPRFVLSGSWYRNFNQADHI